MQTGRLIIPALAFLIATPALAYAQNAPDDLDVTNAVEREFRYDHAVPENPIDVTTNQGIVTLTGTVSNVLAKDRATRIAETVRGVRSVVNRVDVMPPTPRTDATIRSDVARALLEDPAADAYEISVMVDNGHVTLTGTVDSWAEKQIAANVAKGVAGVTGLTDDIRAMFTSERNDREIQQDIVQTLRWDALVDDGMVDVTVHDGDVTLSGIAGSAAEKHRARFDAWTSGVKSVDDSALEVARWTRDPDLRKTKYVAKSDTEIEAAVEAALRRDPRVRMFTVTPSVTNRVVTLRGVVDNLKARRSAEADAKNTVGVLSVENALEVRPVEIHADTAVARRIRAALMRDAYVDRFDIGVRVFDGTAYLSGTVDSWFEKNRVDDIASGIRGVVEVENNIEVNMETAYLFDPWIDPLVVAYSVPLPVVKPGVSYTPMRDRQIERNIEKELFWSPFVDSGDVDVKVEAGVATLEGTVDSQMEKTAAHENAYQGGAFFVHDHLVVDPD